MTYYINATTGPHTPALTNMGITVTDRPAPSDDPERVMARLLTLTSIERDICLMHFVDGRTQSLIAEWLDINRFTVIEHLESAIRKVPELAKLRTLSRGPSPRIKVVHLSQLRSHDREGGLFNIDEL